MTYRLPIRSYTPMGARLFADVAIKAPPGAYGQLLTKHQLEPLNGVIAAIGRFETDAEATAAHEDLMTVIHCVDLIGATVAQDQGEIYRNRQLGLLFNKPVVLIDDVDNILVIDLRAPPAAGQSIYDWINTDPLALYGWNVCHFANASDGSYWRLSSPTFGVGKLMDDIETWLML